MSEALTQVKPRAHKANPTSKYARLSRAEINLLFQLNRDGLSQTAIAQRLDCDISTVCRWLQTIQDTTETAKTKLRAAASSMADHVIKKGKPHDHIAVLKGLNVLEDEQSQGVTVLVGAGGTVNIGLPNTGSLTSGPVVEALSPPSSELPGER